MFVLRTASPVFRTHTHTHIWGYKSYVRVLYGFCSIWRTTPRLQPLSTFSVRSLYTRSHTTLKSQTPCSFQIRFLLYCVYRSDAASRVYVLHSVSVVFSTHTCLRLQTLCSFSMRCLQSLRIELWGYKPYVALQVGFCSVSHANLRLPTQSSFSLRSLW